MQALRDRLHPDTFGPDWEVITIPVKYDFGELWRWSVVLERFALSAGNTVGITGAEVVINGTGHGFNEEPRVWLNGVEPLRRDSTGSDWDPSTARTILMVWAVDPPLAAEALPDLLPELGIPADAVGVVKHDNTTPVIVTHAAGSGGTAPRLRSAVGPVGVNSDGMPISIDTTMDSYPKRRTETADVQRLETAPPLEADATTNAASYQGAPNQRGRHRHQSEYRRNLAADSDRRRSACRTGRGNTHNPPIPPSLMTVSGSR